MRHFIFLGLLIVWLNYIYTHGRVEVQPPQVDMSQAYEISPEQFKAEHNL